MLTVPFRLTWNLLVLGVRGVEWLILWPFVLLRARRRRFVALDLGGSFHLTPRQGLAALFGRDQSYAALDRQLERIERDARVEGVVLRLRSPTLSLTDAALLQQRLLRSRARGKRVVCFLESGGVPALTVAAAADTVMMVPSGRLLLPGLAFELTFLRDLLGRAGLRPQFIHIGRYKTAGHLLARRGPSGAQTGMMRRLLEDVGQTLGERLRRDGHDRHSPTWPTWELGPSVGVAEARRAGLVDHQAYLDQVRVRLQAERAEGDFDPFGTFGDEERAREHGATLKKLPATVVQEASRHARLRPKPVKLVPLWGTRPEIHVVEMNGMILPDEAVSGPLGGRPHIAPAAVRRVFKSLREARQVRAVVLAIDSRGGSALASDIIWREVRRLRRKKPVVAVLRSVAASGGYYIAVGADDILADAATLTGSIGVVAGKISTGQMLERASVVTETLTLGRHATLLSPRHPWTDQEVDALRRDVRATYRRFVSRVALGRELKAAKVHLLARGQVYTGRQAHARGLVDGLGDIEDAVSRAAAQAEVPREIARVRYRGLVKPTLKTLLRGAQVASSGWVGGLVEPHLEEALALAALLRVDPLLTYFEGRLVTPP